ncbi:hypothetical protein Ahy_B02g057268 [Arachis hypogaea]|uniref:Uncharacterized protein n=1 Tax=Arachis hypogaea TaxID=3818 RepID=A0A445ABW3_ARAHY|nr:hypothetical protein Ahy_B02g057268 [Arachis hypogaea]
MSSESVKQSYLKSEEKIRDDSQNGEEGAARGRRGDGDGNRTIASRTNLMEDGRRARKKTENGGSTWITPTVRRETPRMATDGGSGSLSSAAVEERMKKVQLLLSFKEQGANLVTASFHDHHSPCQFNLSSFMLSRKPEIARDFLPSEFGMNPGRMEHALEPGRATFDDRMVVRKAIEEAKIPHTYISAN